MKPKYYCIFLIAISNLIYSFFSFTNDCVMVGSYGGGYSGFGIIIN